MTNGTGFSVFYWQRSAMLVAACFVGCLALACGGQGGDGANPSAGGTGGGGSGGSGGGTGGSTGGTGGATGGTGGTGSGAGGSGMPGPVGFTDPVQGNEGKSADRWTKRDVTRDGINYYFMANGWGPKFQSQTVSWKGTSFTVESMEGNPGDKYEPASYPTMFCGLYSDSHSKDCGLPRALTEITSLKTGWRWNPNANTGQYNTAYDIWLGTGTTIASFSAYLMVWLRDPPGQQPAGTAKAKGVTVTNVPGLWDVWYGAVGGKPYVAYVRPEGQDSLELEFDVMDFVRDLPGRSITLPGSHVLSVAVGFEIWKGPITKLESQDFYLSLQ